MLALPPSTKVVISTGASQRLFLAFASRERVGSRSGETSLRSHPSALHALPAQRVGLSATSLQLQAAAEGAGAVVRLGAVVVGEDGIEAAVAEEGAAEFADLRRSENPAGGLGVELFELLEFAILRFAEDVGAHGGGEIQRVVFGSGFFARLPGGAVVAEAAASGGALGRAIDEHDFAGVFVERDDVGFAAGAFEFIERAQFFWTRLEFFLDRRPGKTFVAMRVFVEAGFQGGNKRGGFLGREGVFRWHDGRDSNAREEEVDSQQLKIEKRSEELASGAEAPFTANGFVVAEATTP